MKLYICWGTFSSPRPGGHPCKNALEALKDAGHDPEVVKTYGTGLLPEGLNAKVGRGPVVEKTGQKWVPVLELDDGEVVHPSEKIVEWANANPARRRAQPAAG